MNRFEFYQSIDKYNSLAHSGGYKPAGTHEYVAKIDNFWGPGKHRYFYSQQEWNNYNKNKGHSENAERNKNGGSKWEKGITYNGYKDYVRSSKDIYDTYHTYLDFNTYLENPHSTPIATAVLKTGYNSNEIKEAKAAIEKAIKFDERESKYFKEKLKNDKTLKDYEKEQILKDYERNKKQLLEFYDIVKDEESFNKHREKTIDENFNQRMNNKNYPFDNYISSGEFNKKVDEYGEEIIYGYYKNYLDWAKEYMKENGYDDWYINKNIPLISKALDKKRYVFLKQRGLDKMIDSNLEKTWGWVFDNSK